MVIRGERKGGEENGRENEAGREAGSENGKCRKDVRIFSPSPPPLAASLARTR